MTDRLPPGYRFLRLFADIRPGEASKALLLALNVFLLLLAYYILKPLRESLLLVDKDMPQVKSYLSGAQAVLFVFVIKAFSRLASKVPRARSHRRCARRERASSCSRATRCARGR